jgi:hypothetical protein
VPNPTIQGDSDTSTLIDLMGRKTASLIRGSRLKVYEGTAHGLPITHIGLTPTCLPSPKIELANRSCQLCSETLR